MARVLKHSWDPVSDKPVVWYEEQSENPVDKAIAKAELDWVEQQRRERAAQARIDQATQPGVDMIRRGSELYADSALNYPLGLAYTLGGGLDAAVGWLTAKAANSPYNPFVETDTERDEFQRELKTFYDVAGLAAGMESPSIASINRAQSSKPLAPVGDLDVPPGTSVVRLDNEFRGHGPVSVSIPENPQKPYAVRLTGLDQIEDMIASGVVRPKAGGYGKQNKATLYFGESDTVGPTIFTTLSDAKGARIVADSNKIAGRSEYIPIHDLKHVFVLRDGKEVDILKDILEQNKNWGN